MGPKLKENPREWKKFAATMALALGALSVLLWKRRMISQTSLIMALTALAIAPLICLVRPRWFRGIYRVGMTVSFHIGQIIGKILLAFFFWLVLTPTGLLLRLCGKDLLDVKKRTTATSYWQPARVGDQFDRQF